VHHAKDKCAFVRANCSEESVGLFDYLELYYCRLGNARIFAFIIIAAWLAMLFATIGIAASDFFCVNLSTIASVLGMSENMAGVTFLAFGNGSPDVFSTFAAMKIDSGSLAVGELIGAACFITAVVAGSMAIVRPFRVGRKSFVRDVSFFLIAVVFGLFFLADGKIRMWECIVMIAFYLYYVVFVIGWHWIAGWKKHKRRKERHTREHYTAPEEEELLRHDEDDEDAGVGGGGGPQDYLSAGHDFRALEDAAVDREDEDEQEQREYAELSSNMRISRPGIDRRLTSATIRPSLVGALEFRAVLNSLEKTKNLQGRQIHLRRYSDDPLFPSHSSQSALVEPTVYIDAQGDRHTPQSLLKPTGRMRAVSVNDAVNATVDPDTFRVVDAPDLLVDAEEEDDTPKEQVQQKPEVRRQLPTLRIDTPSNFLAPPSPGRSSSNASNRSSPVSPMSKSLPRLLVSDSDAESTLSVSPAVSTMLIRAAPVSPSSIRLPRSSIDSPFSLVGSVEQTWKRFKYWPYSIVPPPQKFFEKLFPTLRGFRNKTFFEKVTALIAVPSVFFLTLTLPVVEGTRVEKIRPLPVQSNGPPPGSPASFVSTTTAATPQMPALTEEPRVDKDWNRWLVAIQCFTAPIFIVLVIFGDSDTRLLKPILYALLVGLISLAVLLTFTDPGKPPRLHYLLCFAGFVVAVSWISTVAEEVVGILKAFGVIFNISDAILGLTIFAVGNSLGDLVADITIARLGFPVMALSACFGGPMLNILLGIGVSGLYMTLSRGTSAYGIDVSSTLVISAVTLLVTLLVLLVWVPLNRWMMSRRIGVTLIAIWTVGTIVNVIVDITGVGSTWGPHVETAL
jgi:sodium/potassium/calcium exchanger 6